MAVDDSTAMALQPTISSVVEIVARAGAHGWALGGPCLQFPASTKDRVFQDPSAHHTIEGSAAQVRRLGGLAVANGLT